MTDATKEPLRVWVVRRVIGPDYAQLSCPDATQSARLARDKSTVTEHVAIPCEEWDAMEADLIRLKKENALADFAVFDDVPTDDQCEQILADLDAYATKQGEPSCLPDSTDDNAAMYAIIRAALARTEAL